MKRDVRRYLSSIGRRGGLRSRRRLDSETARRMVRLREARRAYRLYHTLCFWSFDPGYTVGFDDIDWVAEQLMKNGDRAAWEKGAKLCR
jgi:hypothetical protein